MRKWICVLILLLVLPFTTLWRAYAIKLAWGWLLTPLFGLEPIGLLQAIALSMFIGFLSYHHHRTPEADPVVITAEAIGIAIAGPALFILMAWCVKLFI